jgi:uncharacterized cupin superfamily protein
VASIREPEFDAASERPGFEYRRARLGRQAGGSRLGASLYAVPPGQATFPYHWHAANEELLIVLSGTVSVRTPSGWADLEEGRVLSFPRGQDGAHQVANRTGEEVRFLVVSEMNAPEVSGYPDSDKVLAATRPPGGAGGAGIFTAFRLADEVDYWEDEEPPGDRG